MDLSELPQLSPPLGHPLDLLAMDRASSSLPQPVLPVLRAHVSDVSVATTELDVTSLPELTDDDRAGHDGFDLLLDDGADGRMNGGCDGGYDDLRDLTRHRSRSLRDDGYSSIPQQTRTNSRRRRHPG